MTRCHLLHELTEKLREALHARGFPMLMSPLGVGPGWPSGSWSAPFSQMLGAKAGWHLCHANRHPPEVGRGLVTGSWLTKGELKVCEVPAQSFREREHRGTRVSSAA